MLLFRAKLYHFAYSEEPIHILADPARLRLSASLLISHRPHLANAPRKSQFVATPGPQLRWPSPMVRWQAGAEQHMREDVLQMRPR